MNDRDDAATVLLIHGSLIDARAWNSQRDALGARYRVLAPSLRHCYPERWDGTGDDFSVEQHAADLAALIDAQGVAPAHVVGHSRGGAVAIQLALTYPHRIRSLVLADPGGLEALLPDTAEGHAMATESAAMFARLAADLADGDHERAARNFAEALGGPGAWERRSPEQRQWLLDNITTGPACAQRPHWPRDMLSTLPGPILLVTGARSPRRYPLMLAELARIKPRVQQIVTIPDAAHAMNRENPAAFNAAVLRFLDTVDSANPR